MVDHINPTGFRRLPLVQDDFVGTVTQRRNVFGINGIIATLAARTHRLHVQRLSALVDDSESPVDGHDLVIDIDLHQSRTLPSERVEERDRRTGRTP